MTETYCSVCNGFLNDEGKHVCDTEGKIRSSKPMLRPEEVEFGDVHIYPRKELIVYGKYQFRVIDGFFVVSRDCGEAMYLKEDSLDKFWKDNF